MTNNDEMQFAEAMTMLAVVFDKEITKTLAKVYFNTLIKYDINQVQKAVTDHIAKGRFFPKPIELVELINKGKPTLEDKALTAWMAVAKQVNDCGSYRKPEFSNPYIKTVIDSIGGWRHICPLDDKKMSFKKKEFIDGYASLTKQNPEELPEALRIALKTESKASYNQNKALSDGRNTVAAGAKLMPINDILSGISDLRNEIK